MPADDRKKGVAVCDECKAVCAVWVTDDRDAVPVSSRSGCECPKSVLRVLDAEMVG
ncbi:hypothetical protein [Natronococcus wangiae]|uniref:hypothetical protein n=1 Tax=Natronococcus wangiae TaxID=3068275 RepID=UPI00273DBFF7|nr:hypothetical protein [Natronococcus sp. AD5]